MIAPHNPRRKTKTQDGRGLRRYRRRWHVERLFAWMLRFRRLVTRYEHHARNFSAFTMGMPGKISMVSDYVGAAPFVAFGLWWVAFPGSVIRFYAWFPPGRARTPRPARPVAIRVMGL